MKRRWPRALVVSGVVALLSSCVPAFLKFNTEVNFSNLGSSPYWVRPTPTPYDQFMLQFPAKAFFVVVLIAGLAMLVTGLLRAKRD